MSDWRFGSYLFFAALVASAIFGTEAQRHFFLLLFVIARAVHDLLKAIQSLRAIREREKP